MDITYNFISFIDTLGVIQGLLFGSMLILLHSKRNRPTLFLGLFILLFALEPIPSILRDLGILEQRPAWELIPVNFHFLAFPMFYIYIQKTSIFGNTKPSYWTLIPGGVESFIAFVIFFLPVATKLQIRDSSYNLIYFLLGLGYTIYISVLILKFINGHFKELESQYSEITNKKLSWSRFFIYASIGFHLLLLLNFFTENTLLYTLISIFNVILIYWVSFKGITQKNIVALVWIPSAVEAASPNIQKTDIKQKELEELNITGHSHHELMSQEDALEVVETIEDYIKNSECYTRQDLTIIDIAEAVNIHPKRISHAINSQLRVNFNTYINTYRVERSKTLMNTDLTDNLSIEGIGLEAGFHSKTTFYSSFKKMEGTTPAKYKAN